MTEQTYVRNFFTNYWKAWVLFLILGLVVGYLIASQLKPKFEGAVTFSVSRTPDVAQSDAPFYVYDGYYNEQAAVTLRNNFASWLTSPKTGYDIYTQAGQNVDQMSADALGQLFKVNDNPEVNTVNVVYSNPDKAVAEKIGAATVAYASSTYPQVSNKVDLHTTTPLVVQVNPPRFIITLATGFALVIASFFVTLLMHYLKNDTA